MIVVGRGSLSGGGDFGKGREGRGGYLYHGARVSYHT